MFFHIYKYRLKSMIRQKEEVFWIFCFPIILAICFFAAFSNISKSTEEFSVIDVAVIIEDKENSTYFKAMLDSLSDKDNEDAMLNITYTNEDEASEMLNNEKVLAIITFKNNEPSLTINQNGVYESILKCVLDKYMQTMSILGNIDTSNPEVTMNVMQAAANETSYICEAKLTDGNTDNFSDYYYSLIAMACMFGAMSGQVCATQMKANLSSAGMRKNLVPVNRMTIIAGDFFATFTMHALSDTLLVVFLQYVLKLNLAPNTWLILVTAYVGSLIGISQGILIGSIPKLSENAKMGINAGISLFLSFLSGLMIGGLKYQIEKVAPIVNRLNPATVITDALYSLNIYDTYDKYISSMITLVVMSVVLCIASYFLTRRESYENL